MKKGLIVFLILFTFQVEAQVHPANVVEKFYEDLNTGDSLTIRSYFHDDAMIKHLSKDSSFSFTIDEFMYAVPDFKSKTYQEEIIHINYDIASTKFADLVEVEYKFYLNGEFHHCGSDVFIMTLDDSLGSMKIQQVLTSEGECWEQSDHEKSIEEALARERDDAIARCDAEMDNWHVNASDANFKEYFEVMADEFYYLGTDPDERWSKAEFAKFCQPYFDKGTTWTFEAERRNWDVSEDGKTAWFDEYLFTRNMDYCRGSGVWQKVDGHWKIYHYNLTVLIENQKMKKFLKLRKK
jgi:ketosteroid isomerase-like protein